MDFAFQLLQFLVKTLPAHAFETLNDCLGDTGTGHLLRGFDDGVFALLPAHPVDQRRGLVANPSYFYWYWYLRPAAVHGGTQVAPGPHTLHTGVTPDALAQALGQSPTTTLQAQAACRARGRPPR